MNLAQMRQRVEELKAKASGILDRVEADNRHEMNEAEQAEYDSLKSEIDGLNPKIKAAEQLAERRREMQASTSSPALQTTVNDPDPATTGGFKSIAEFACAVRDAAIGQPTDKRLMASTPTNIHQGSSGDGEGFLLPTQYRDQIWNAVEDVDSLLSRFSPEPTGARSVEYLKDETTPWGAAGVTAAWRAEGGQMTPSKFALKGGRMEIHDLYAFCAVTDETLADAPRLSSTITRQAARAISWTASDAIMNGDGVGKPLGYMNAPAKIAVAKESGQAAKSIVLKNINKMFMRLKMVPGETPFWLANQDIFDELQNLVLGDRPLFIPPGGIAGSPNGALLGRPLIFTEHNETLGTEGDLQLVTPGGYLAARRGGGPEFAQSMHLWFDYALQALRWTFRVGGTPLLSAPIVPNKGTNTKSHFVSLATRA